MGRSTDRVNQLRHALLSTFDVGTELSDQELRGVARQLVASGLLAVDHTAYGALRLTEASRAVLKGEQPVSLRKQAPKLRQAKKKRVAALDGLSAAETGLYERLRAWRADAARAHGVPAYVIFHDATLRDITRLRPRSLEALGTVSGVGARQLEGYGGNNTLGAGERGRVTRAPRVRPPAGSGPCAIYRSRACGSRNTGSCESRCINPAVQGQAQSDPKAATAAGPARRNWRG